MKYPRIMTKNIYNIILMEVSVDGRYTSVNQEKIYNDISDRNVSNYNQE